ncbi:MAG: S1 RNA-binding domain-containing protein [Limnochordales bacterium]|nr:S1 RNA-binding domain-containing protein [Limnochordales bacterium]
MSIEVGSILEGRVTGITNFGAFVELGEGMTGLVHISEVADAYVHDIKDYLKENDIVKVKVINVRDGKIGLSIRQVNNPSSAARKPGRGRGRAPKSFEDKLSRFMRESDERLAHLRKSLDAKRGGRGTRRAF